MREGQRQIEDAACLGLDRDGRIRGIYNGIYNGLQPTDLEHLIEDIALLTAR
jgi:hypothetical protein